MQCTYRGAKGGGGANGALFPWLPGCGGPTKDTFKLFIQPSDVVPFYGM